MHGYKSDIYSERLNSEMISNLKPDFIISYNYRYIVQNDVISMMGRNIINMHISYLPWNRGASPNLWSFLEGTPKGVTIHLMSAGLDKGKILCQRECFFDENTETLSSSYETLHKVMQQLFYEKWNDIYNDKITPVPQDGIGSYHTVKETEAIMEDLSITYSEPISDIKRRYDLHSC